MFLFSQKISNGGGGGSDFPSFRIILVQPKHLYAVVSLTNTMPKGSSSSSSSETKYGSSKPTTDLGWLTLFLGQYPGFRPAFADFLLFSDSLEADS